MIDFEDMGCIGGDKIPELTVVSYYAHLYLAEELSLMKLLKHTISGANCLEVFSGRYPL